MTNIDGNDILKEKDNNSENDGERKSKVPSGDLDNQERLTEVLQSSDSTEEDILNCVAETITGNDPEFSNAGNVIKIIDEEKNDFDGLAIDTFQTALPNYLGRITFFKDLTSIIDDHVYNLIKVKERISEVKDIDTFCKIFQESTPLFLAISSFNKGTTIPLQLIMGLVYKGLKEYLKTYNKNNKEKINFEKFCDEYTPKIDKRKRQRFMVASDIVDYEGYDEYYIIGFERIYNIMSLKRKGILNIDSLKSMFESCMDFNIDEIREEDYSRLADLIITYYRDLKNKGVDIELIKKMFHTGGKLSKRDINCIDEFDEKYDDFSSNYIESLLKNDYDSERALIEMEDLYDDKFIKNNEANSLNTKIDANTILDTGEMVRNQQEQTISSDIKGNPENNSINSDETKNKEDVSDPVYNVFLIHLTNLKEILVKNPDYKFSKKLLGLIFELIYVLAKRVNLDQPELYKKIEEIIKQNKDTFEYDLEELCKKFDIDLEDS